MLDRRLLALPVAHVEPRRGRALLARLPPEEGQVVRWLLGAWRELRSREQRALRLAAVLRRATPLEAKYVVRSIRGKLRAGLGDRSLRAALAQAGMAKAPDRSAELAAALEQLGHAQDEAKQAEKTACGSIMPISVPATLAV